MSSEQITGRFTYTVFKTDTYMVAQFESEDGSITITGPFFDYDRKNQYTLTGSYVDHPKYGFQFNFIHIEECLPDEKEDIVRYMAAAFESIGKKTAEKIVNHFGKETLTLLKENPARIYEVKLSEKQYEKVLEGFESMNDPKSDAIFSLVSGGFSSQQALLIYNEFKENTDTMIENNPFLIYLKVYGIPFKTVCSFAEKLDFADKVRKLKIAFMVYVFKEVTFTNGDTWLYHDEFEKHYYKNFHDDDLDEIILEAIRQRYLYHDENNDRYYLFDEYRNELIVSEFLKTKMDSLNLSEDIISDAIDSIAKQLDVLYDSDQIQAIRNFFFNDISIITGGPGTGKTTVVRSLVAIFSKYLPFNSVVVVAPTGRAAKRISEICNVESKTIHSLLRWNKETNTFVFNEENPLLYDAVIIDEFSMVDNFLFASLLKASFGVRKLCIIGDAHQLPSIRQGDLLFDLIESNQFTLTRLTENHRQKEGSEIIELSNAIIEGHCSLEDYHKDIRHLSLTDVNSIIDIMEDCLLEGYSQEDIQVLAPMYKGSFGIDNLNAVLQEHFNPPSKDKQEKNANGMLFREGDRILQLKNRPTDDVYNGDIGILEEINEKEKYFLIDFQGTLVFYKFNDLQDISLAYALSVHKAQGSEYRVCIFVLPEYSKGMLNRKLIYTAVSRAKIRLYILGDKEAFYKGVDLLSRKRKTTLKQMLIGN